MYKVYLKSYSIEDNIMCEYKNTRRPYSYKIILCRYLHTVLCVFNPFGVRGKSFYPYVYFRPADFLVFA